MITDTRKEIVMSKVAPHLWFAKDAEEAASVYVSLLPDSRIDSVTTMPADSPSGPPGSVQMVEFTLAGQQFLALAAGPLDPCELYQRVVCRRRLLMPGCGRTRTRFPDALIVPG
jgi:3-demethylubiquinone-9 3-methyltransferase